MSLFYWLLLIAAISLTESIIISTGRSQQIPLRFQMRMLLSSELKTFFANPYHSWERGLNKHTNGLIREFYPKSTNFNIVKEEDFQNKVNLFKYRHYCTSICSDRLLILRNRRQNTLAVGVSLLPIGAKPLYAWMTGFWSLGMAKSSHSQHSH